ncbi:abortive infection protein [Azotobacter chroococcum subsp. isscasi]|uniref:AAA family ATPase n=1 Tax=Azotobacter chroococcum TaxID=353 RepID=UPI00103A6FF9|nr:ATP-binding protein [Azotobacter chroococcum]TBW09686.1 abortive infection protein [Azotobacter chroococcum subsp. isscasi]
MIKSLRFSNFYSFAEETQVDFSLGRKPTPSGFDTELADCRLNKVIAVVGANGSGKTQLIKPLAFLKWFICDSFLQGDPDTGIAYSPHMLHAEEDTCLEVDFFLQGVEHRYQLVMNAGRVVSEVLLNRTSTQFSYLFRRERSGDGFTFKQKGFPFPKSQAQGLRSNASLLAAAHSYDIKEARPFIEYFRRVVSNVASTDRHHFQQGALFSSAENYERSPTIKARMVEAMPGLDLGLSGVDIRALDITAEDGKSARVYMPFGQHRSSDGRTFELSFFEESSGTQSAFVLLERLLTALEYGGLAVIDEIDNDLHPHLMPRILDWFRFEHSNPHQAQLIFTCHTPEVLNRLQKHQVYLCEKEDQCSTAWRLDEVVGLRADDNLYAKYMAGALGGVPEL